MSLVDLSKITLENIDCYKNNNKHLSRKEYQHWYYITKTKEKRKQKRLEKNRKVGE